MAMDALHVKFDSVDNQFRQIAIELRGYLDHGITGTRKVKPPGTKAGRELLQHILGRMDQIVSTDLADVRRLSLSSNSSTPMPPRVTKEADTPPSHASPSALSQTVPQDGSPPQQLQQHQTTTPPAAPSPHDGPGDDRHESLKQSPQQHSHHSPPALKLKADLITPVTPITPGRGPSGVSSTGSRDVPAAPLHPALFEHSAPLFDCNYQDIHILNEVFLEQCSSHPVVRDRGYFKLQVQNLPPLNVESMDRPTRDHAQSFRYKADQFGLIKVDTGKKPKFSEPRLPFPKSAKQEWSFEEQRELWNSTAKDPPKGHRPYIIGNPLFDDIELSPGEKLRQRGQGVLEGINTQYVYFNLTGKTITTMHREDAHVRSENILRSGENKFWCFVKPSSTAKLEEAMHGAYPEMRNCSQAIRHLSRHIPPARLDEWGVEYTLDYCVPGQAVVTEPGTYHQVLNLGPNYAVAINLEYMSSPDMPPNYVFCDKACPDKFAISAKDFQIYRGPTPPEEEQADKADTKNDGKSPALHQQNDGPHQRSSTEMVLGLTPTLTPERENLEGSIEMEATSQSKVQGHTITDHLQPRVVEVPHLCEAPSSTETPATTRHESEHFNQTTERVPLLQPLATHTTAQEDSGISLPKNHLLLSPSQSQQPKSQFPTQLNRQPELFSQLQHPNISPRAPTQTLPNLSAFSTGGGFPYTPKLLVPKQMVEQPPARTQERQVNEGPTAAVDSRFEPTVPQIPSPTLVQPGQIGSPCAHTLKEFSLRPTPQVDIINPERNSVPTFTSGANANVMELAGKGQKRQADMSLTEQPQKRQRPETTNADDHSQRSAFNHLATLIRGCAVAQADALQTAQICSKVSFERLAGLVRDYRHHAKHSGYVGGGINLVNHVDGGFQGSSALHVYLSRFSKIKLAEWVEEAIEEDGSQAASEDHTEQLLSELGWDESELHKLHDYLREGKCWKAICGKYEGVLCLMAPDIPDTQFTELALFQSRIATFHAQLDIPFVRRLCEMGKVLEKAIWNDLILPEFIWEAVDTNYLSLDEVSSLLGRFRSIKQNQFDPEKYLWPKPPRWNWKWPADPTSLSPRDKKYCGICNITSAKGNKSPCACFETHVPSIPRISDDGSKGSGVRAVGMYNAGAILGELLGELAPLGTYQSTADWTIQFRRPDLDDEPVAEIYTKEMGNWVRKVNHCSTQPSAVFQVMKISGKWRQMLLAVRDIKDGEEITAKYGRGFSEKQPYFLVEGFL